MSHRPAVSPAEKTRLVLDLLAGRITLSVAAQQAGVSAQAVSVWRRQFVEAGQHGLQPSRGSSESARRERELLNQIDGLKAALGEAHLALRARGGGLP
ncbi:MULTISPECIES: helix-turn-helix domain-containing protein [unclassified Kitasatospora]|uniref:helix-turn-helix domain-containing protein n=1 Tax=unclassified Kitasatospora TaxID=2633591 RepID=UPI0033F2A3C7